jgi:hypothetical protein
MRCEVEFEADGIIHRGMCLDLSLNGLFIETDFRCSLHTMLDLLIRFPDGIISRLKGKVVRSLGNGIGVGLIEKDAPYLHYYSSFLLEPKSYVPSREP